MHSYKKRLSKDNLFLYANVNIFFTVINEKNREIGLDSSVFHGFC
jgi:hypothetical protein